MTITSEELRKLSERIVVYSNDGNQSRTCINACRKAIDALARLGAVVMQSETRRLAANVGNDPQMPLPFDGKGDAK